MAGEFTQKRPVFKQVSKTPARWRDLRTGELLTRNEYNKRVVQYDNEQAEKQQRMASFQAALSGDAPVNQRQPATPEPIVTGGDTPATPRVSAPPPPMPSLGGIAIDAADTLTDNLDKPAKPGICESLSLGASVALSGIVAFLVPDQASYLVPPPIELGDVLRPLGRIADRHMPVVVTMTEDGRDLAEAGGALAALGAHMAKAYADARKQDRLEREYEQREWRKRAERGGGNNGGSSGRSDGAAAGDSVAPPWAAFADHLRGEAQSAIEGRYGASDGSDDGSPNGGQDRGDITSARQAVAGLLAADAVGRARLGL